MALSLIELHCGPTLTAKVARDLVVFLRRHGGHDQTSIYLSFRDHLHPGVHQVQDWLSTHFAEPVRDARVVRYRAPDPEPHDRPTVEFVGQRD